MLMLVLINFGLLLQQTVTPINSNDPAWLPYGFAGLVAIQLFQLIRWILRKDDKNAEERTKNLLLDIEGREKREERLAVERSEKYREDNRARDERWALAVADVKRALETVDKNYRDTSQKFIEANRENIEKFIGVVNKVMDQNSYTMQVLTGLKASVERLESTNKTEFEVLKNSILDHLQKLTLNYEIKKKADK